jgi:NADPH:quinone reductase-like Zn-dependent oxidoreductase
MKAIRIHSFGKSNVLQLEDIPPPELGAGDVLIRVHAAGVNPVDFKMRSGNYRRDVPLPTTLGREVSGTVERVGAHVHDLKPGDAIYGMLGKYSGGYAELARALREEVAGKPETLDDVHAGAVPLAATTAWQGLFDHGGLASGQRVLIHGGAGGVGHFAIQFARLRGAEVITTARREDAEFLRELGADQVIDYRDEKFEDEVEDVDLVLDLIGGKIQDRSWSVLKKGGRLISVLGEPSAEKARKFGVKAKGFMAQPKTAQLAEMAGLIDAGQVKVVVERVHPLQEAAQAQDELEHDHIRGKVVLELQGAL